MKEHSPRKQLEFVEIKIIKEKKEKVEALLTETSGHEKSYTDLKKWLKHHYNKEKGLQGPNMLKFVADMNAFHDNNRFTESSYKTFRRKLDFLERILPVYKKEVLPEWMVYFHYNYDYEFESLLGQGVLKVTEPGKADFKNVQDGISPDYSGLFNYAGGIYSFNLTAPGDRKLHLKLYWNGGSQVVGLGAYITFERNSIVTGAIVAVRRENTAAMPRPLLSWQKDREAFEAVPKAIRKFLSIRHLNYRKIPNNIETFEGLEAEMNKVPLEKYIASRFMEPAKPVIFIANPSSSTDGKAIDEIVRELKNKFNRQYSIVHTSTDSDLRNEKALPVNTLKIIQRARIFILFIPAIKQLSFSIVQFSWATIFAKDIIVFSQKDILSRQFLSLEGKDGLNVIFDAFGTIKKDKNKIIDSLSKRLRNMLPKD